MDNTQQVSSNLGLNWSSSSLLKICFGPARQLWGAALAALQLWKARADRICSCFQKKYYFYEQHEQFYRYLELLDKVLN